MKLKFPGNRQSMQRYNLSTQGFKEETFDSVWFVAEGTLISAPAIPYREGVGGEKRDRLNKLSKER